MAVDNAFCYLRHAPLGYVFVRAVAENVEISRKTLTNEMETPLKDPCVSRTELTMPLSNESRHKGEAKRGSSVMIPAETFFKTVVIKGRHLSR